LRELPTITPPSEKQRHHFLGGLDRIAELARPWLVRGVSERRPLNRSA
jgi:hypothetical protein